MAQPVSPTSKVPATQSLSAVAPQPQSQSVVRQDSGFQSKSSLAAAADSRESSVAFDRAPSFTFARPLAEPLTPRTHISRQLADAVTHPEVTRFETRTHTVVVLPKVDAEREEAVSEAGEGDESQSQSPKAADRETKRPPVAEEPAPAPAPAPARPRPEPVAVAPKAPQAAPSGEGSSVRETRHREEKSSTVVVEERVDTSAADAAKAKARAQAAAAAEKAEAEKAEAEKAEAAEKAKAEAAAKADAAAKAQADAEAAAAAKKGGYKYSYLKYVTDLFASIGTGIKNFVFSIGGVFKAAYLCVKGALYAAFCCIPKQKADYNAKLQAAAKDFAAVVNGDKTSGDKKAAVAAWKNLPAEAQSEITRIVVANAVEAEKTSGTPDKDIDVKAIQKQAETLVEEAPHSRDVRIAAKDYVASFEPKKKAEASSEEAESSKKVANA